MVGDRGDRDRAGSHRPLKFEYSKNRVAWRLASRTHQLREQQPCDCFGWRPSDLSYFLSERRSNVHHGALNIISSVVRNTVDGDSHASHQKWTALAHEARFLPADVTPVGGPPVRGGGPSHGAQMRDLSLLAAQVR